MGFSVYPGLTGPRHGVPVVPCLWQTVLGFAARQASQTPDLFAWASGTARHLHRLGLCPFPVNKNAARYFCLDAGANRKTTSFSGVPTISISSRRLLPSPLAWARLR